MRQKNGRNLQQIPHVPFVIITSNTNIHSHHFNKELFEFSTRLGWSDENVPHMLPAPHPTGESSPAAVCRWFLKQNIHVHAFTRITPLNELRAQRHEMQIMELAVTVSAPGRV